MTACCNEHTCTWNYHQSCLSTSITYHNCLLKCLHSLFYKILISTAISRYYNEKPQLPKITIVPTQMLKLYAMH